MTDGSYTALLGRGFARGGWGQNPVIAYQEMNADAGIPGKTEVAYATINKEFKEDHFGELDPVLNQSEILFTRDMLPADYRFSEQPQNHEYLNEFDPITRRYEASDAPPKTELKHPGKRLPLNGFSNVIIFVGDDGIEAHYGEGLISSRGASPWIKVDTQLHSQHPSIKIQITDPEKKEPTVTCHIFPGCIKRNAHGNCNLDIRINRDTSTGRAVDNPEIRDRKINNALMEIKIKLWRVRPSRSNSLLSAGQTLLHRHRPGRTAPNLRRVPFTRPSDDDIAPAIDRTPGDPDGDQYLPRLAVGGEQAFETFKSWLLCAFQACALHGYEWFYAMQMQMPRAMNLTDVKFRELKEPRWLTTVFKTTFSRQSTFLQLETYKVVPFVPTTAVASANAKTAVMLPTPEVGAFEFCAAIDRNQQRQSFLLNRFFQSNAFKIKAVLMKHPTVEGKFFASLHVPADVAYANNNCKLESFTHIRVLLKLADYPAVHRFRGMVVDNARDTRMEVILVIEEEAEADFDEHLPSEGFATEEFLVSVECIDDPTPTRRWMNAIRAMNKDHSRKKGIDAKHIVLQCPPTIVDTGFMASEAGADPQCQIIIERVVEEHQLKPTHHEAVNLACTTETGLATIQGLPGTGKTRVLGVIGEIQIKLGKQIKRRRCGFAVAPSNVAVEQLAESVIGDNPRKMECVWYIGSSLANEKVEDGLNGPEDLLAAMRPLWLLVEEAAISSFDSVLANIGFHKKRLAAFRRWADTPEHPMEAKAQVYLDMVQIVQPQNASHKEENHSLHVLEEECSAYYLQHEVDMVFCTNEKSAQGLLGKYYRPSFILQDNAAEINVPEAATPLAAFVESVKLLVQAGDRTQQRPKLASQGFNEHLGMLLKSPMDLISVNELLQRTCTEL